MNAPPNICQTEIRFESILFRPPTLVCDRCQQPVPRAWDTQRTAFDLALERPGVLALRVGVYYCERCHHYFRACPPFVRPKASYTNRVVATAVASVFEDGMAIRRVAQRLARDYWLLPSEAIIRAWCRNYVQGLELEQSYQPWLLSSFSGILCVDELYQKKLAIVLAVDPQEDRLVGYLLKHGSFNSGDLQGFLSNLKAAGIEPEQVVTDGSALYPEVLATVWPAAKHQMCLFHQSRLMTRAARQALRQIQQEIPKPTKTTNPTNQAGRIKNTERGERIALVSQLREQGRGIREIARETGHNVNTIRRWLRGTVQIPLSLPAVPPEMVQAPFRLDRLQPQAAEVIAVPGGWDSWEQIQQIRLELNEFGSKIFVRVSSLNEDEQKQLARLLSSPVGKDLSAVHQFSQNWYNIWWDEKGNRREKEEARVLFEHWRNMGEARKFPSLLHLQEKWDDNVFEKLSHFLEEGEWEATNNAAERKVRQFRQLQAPHFNFRSDQMVEGVLKAQAIHQMERLTQSKSKPTVSSRRGRHSKNSQPGTVCV